MPRATCRCGHELKIADETVDRIVCPGCGAKIRVRQGKAPAKDGAASAADGFIRFLCPCGRRLKVAADDPPSHGKCPDCGKVVPVPDTAGHAADARADDPETPTAELTAADAERLGRWVDSHRDRAARTTSAVMQNHSAPAQMATAAEAGLRVCPRCAKPVHLGADVCRACGTKVPRR